MRKLTKKEAIDMGLPIIKQTMTFPVFKEAYNSFLQKNIFENRTLWGYFENNILIGFSGIYICPETKKAWLSYTSVLPSQQNKGIGSIILSFIEKKAIQKGFEQLFIETYASRTYRKANKFYLKNGYQEYERIENYIGKTAGIFYRKTLINHQVQ